MPPAFSVRPIRLVIHQCESLTRSKSVFYYYWYSVGALQSKDYIILPLYVLVDMNFDFGYDTVAFILVDISIKGHIATKEDLHQSTV